MKTSFFSFIFFDLLATNKCRIDFFQTRKYLNVNVLFLPDYDLISRIDSLLRKQNRNQSFIFHYLIPSRTCVQSIGD